MCNMVEVFRADGKRMWCETKAELREAIGAEPAKNKQYKTWEDGDCLCPCDMKATAKAAGFVLRKTGGMDYLMTVKHATPNMEFRPRRDSGVAPGTQGCASGGEE